jgi:hypothetical protein
MEQIAGLLYSIGYILRSGGAPGADTAFENGADTPKDFVGKRKEIYVPWKGFRGGQTGDIHKIHKRAFVIAAFIHPSWHKLQDGSKKLHARNIHQVLGRDLKTPSKFLICWTKNGELVGGTRTSIVLAREIEIPVYNLGLDKYDQITPTDLVYEILSEIQRT